MDHEGRPSATGPPRRARLSAPAKLTLSLRVVGVRLDGYHLIEAEMATIDLADTLIVGPGDRLMVRGEAPPGAPARGEWRGDRFGSVPTGPDNLVARALRAVGRRADVEVIKRIPPGAGLGGGSADAAAVLRWAGHVDLDVAAGLGADVPFCLTGGRALVRGVGEAVEPLPFVSRTFTLLLPPFGMDTAAVYRAWDRLSGASGTDGAGGAGGVGGNDLEAAALEVDGRLAGWRRALAEISGVEPRLAGSGSTWFVEMPLADLRSPDSPDAFLHLGDERARLVEARTVPALD